MWSAGGELRAGTQKKKKKKPKFVSGGDVRQGASALGKSLDGRFGPRFGIRSETIGDRKEPIASYKRIIVPLTVDNQSINPLLTDSILYSIASCIGQCLYQFGKQNTRTEELQNVFFLFFIYIWLF